MLYCLSHQGSIVEGFANHFTETVLYLKGNREALRVLGLICFYSKDLSCSNVAKRMEEGNGREHFYYKTVGTIQEGKGGVQNQSGDRVDGVKGMDVNDF